MKRFVFLFGFLLVAATVSAQSLPSSWQAKYYNVGAPSPVQTETFLLSAVTCNQVAPTTTSTVNPNRLVWDDVSNPGKVCIFNEGVTGPLTSVPVGSYEGTLTAFNAAGSSAESARVPFSRLAVPLVPTGFLVVR